MMTTAGDRRRLRVDDSGDDLNDDHGGDSVDDGMDDSGDDVNDDNGGDRPDGVSDDVNHDVNDDHGGDRPDGVSDDVNHDVNDDHGGDRGMTNDVMVEIRRWDDGNGSMAFDLDGDGKADFTIVIGEDGGFR